MNLQRARVRGGRSKARASDGDALDPKRSYEGAREERGKGDVILGLGLVRGFTVCLHVSERNTRFVNFCGNL